MNEISNHRQYYRYYFEDLPSIRLSFQLPRCFLRRSKLLNFLDFDVVLKFNMNKDLNIFNDKNSQYIGS